MNFIKKLLCKISPCRKCECTISCFMCVHKHWNKYRKKETFEKIRKNQGEII